MSAEPKRPHIELIREMYERGDMPLSFADRIEKAFEADAARIAELEQLCESWNEFIGTGTPAKYRARIADLEALVDDMLAVWRKVGNNMPILADVVLQRMANARAKSKESLLDGTK